MKYIILNTKIKYFIFFLLFVKESFSQTNLIPNTSFEIYIDCPTSLTQIDYAIPWFSPSGSSDYFNSCFIPPFPIPCGGAGVPNNNMGYQEARTGQAYGGICFCEPGWPNGGYREYIEVKLLDTLKTGKVYCVEFWVSLARFCMNPVPIGVDGLGAFFSKDTLQYSINDTSQVFNVIPQLQNPEWNIITDTSNWVKISGWFVAQGGEDYMTIGNFKRDENTHTLIAYTNIPGPPVGNDAYYFIDDVSVMECDTTKPLSGDNIINVYPNPVEDELTLEAKGNTLPIEFEIYNTIGQLVYKSSMLEKTMIYMKLLTPGMYIIRFRNSERLEYRKVVKCN